MNRYMEGIFSIIIMFFCLNSCNMLHIIEKNETIYIEEEFEKCSFQKNGNISIEEVSKSFINKILGGNEPSLISQWKTKKQIDLFEKIYSLGCVTAKYEHPLKRYESYPYNAICPAFEEYYKYQSLMYSLDSLLGPFPPRSDQLVLEVNLAYSLHINNYYNLDSQNLQIVKNQNSFYYYFLEKDNKKENIDTISFGLLKKPERFISNLDSKYDILNIPSDNELPIYNKSFIGYTMSFYVNYDGFVNSFSYGDIFENCGPMENRVNNMVKEIENYLNIDFKLRGPMF